MTDEQKFLEKIATKAANILHIPLGEIDPAKLLHMYSCLSVLFGGDEELMMHFLNTHNKHLGYCPGAHLTDARFDTTINYLQSMVSH
jgi:hypothetical protein